ncbi:MAG: hypothetical protein FJX75_18160 [Armatimonadetes bacterium]|nr:hypothetical protein [Armatimonadota bacterium]
MVLGLVLSVYMAACSVAQPAKAVVLNVQNGELPSDASVPMALTTEFPEKPDGVSLKVTFGEGAIGQYNPRLKDWTGLPNFRFFAHNAGDKPLEMYLAIRDKSTVDYGTRADFPFTLQPGANKVSIDLSRVKRNQSATPFDFSTMASWYIAKTSEGDGYIVYFGDINLEGGGAAAEAPAAPAVTAGAPGGGTIVLEGRIRIEVDRVTFDKLMAAGGGGAATPTTAPAPAPTGTQKLLLANLAEPLPFEAVEGAVLTLSDDHAAELGGKALKVEFVKPESVLSMGYWGGGEHPNNWTGYNALRFEAFNAGDKVVNCYIAIRDQTPGYEARGDMTFKLEPGLNKVDLPISTIATNAGKQLDKAHVTQWYIAVDQATTVYFASFRVEK